MADMAQYVSRLADSVDEARCKHLADECSACMQAVRKLHANLRAAKEAALERTLPQLRAPASMQPHAVDMDQELDDAARVRAPGLFRCECPFGSSSMC